MMAHEDDRDLDLVRREEDEDASDGLAAALLGHRFEVAGRTAPEEPASPPATAAAAATHAAGRGARPSAREGHYQAVAVAASVMPWASSQRSASIAALQPSAAAVTACRYRWSWTSPAMNTPSIFEPVSSWTTR